MFGSTVGKEKNMLMSFSIENFLSIRDNIVFDFLGTQQDQQDDWYITKPKHLLISSSIGFLGANASGKTTALRGLYFLCWMILGENFGAQNKLRSFTRDNFLIDTWFGNKQPMVFTAKFGSPKNKKVYIYFLKVQIDKKNKEAELKILEEKLIIKSDDNTHEEKQLFCRKINENNKEIKFYNKNPPDTKQGRIVTQFISNNLKGMIRHDTTVLSALNYMPGTSKYMPKLFNVYVNIGNRNSYSISNINAFDIFMNGGQAAEKLKDDKKLLSEINDSFRRIDVGISEISLHKISSKEEKEENIIIFSEHTLKNKKNGKIEREMIPFLLESDGTKNFLEKYCHIRPILKNGGIALIDELDAYMHPHLVKYFLSLFRHPGINTGNGQLIFSSHSPVIFDLLGPSHIFLAEKQNQSSEFFKATSIEKIREDCEYGKNWLTGFYGANPDIY